MIKNFKKMKPKLAILSTHPIQYNVPLFRGLEVSDELSIKVFFGCLQGSSNKSSHDKDFDNIIRWDLDLLSGYQYIALSRQGMQSISGLNSIFLSLLAYLQILFWRPTYVLIFNYSPLFISITLFFLLISGQKIILRADTSDESFDRSYTKQKIRDFLLSILYKYPVKIFPIGSESYDHFIRLGVPARKLKTILYAVDHNIFKRQSEQNNFGLNKKIRLGFVGKFTEVKDPLLIPKALSCLDQNLLNQISFRSAGSGPLLKEFSFKIRKIIRNSYYSYGFLQQDQLVRFYSKIDILILPSIQGEVWGLVINEALSQGVRVIVSDMVACRKDLVLNQSAGWIFVAGNHLSLARAIRTAISHWPWVQTCAHTPTINELSSQIIQFLK